MANTAIRLAAPWFPKGLPHWMSAQVSRRGSGTRSLWPPEVGFVTMRQLLIVNQLTFTCHFSQINIYDNLSVSHCSSNRSCTDPQNSSNCCSMLLTSPSLVAREERSCVSAACCVKLCQIETAKIALLLLILLQMSIYIFSIYWYLRIFFYDSHNRNPVSRSSIYFVGWGFSLSSAVF